MKKLFTLIIICILSLPAFAYNKNTENTDFIVKNKLFAINMPVTLNNLYEIKKEQDKISVFHKASKNTGFGGFVFGVKAYKKPSEHAVLPGSIKLGELTDKKGNLYDIVLKRPTDVQYDYTKNTKPPEDFKRLYDLAENLKINGINGSQYFKNQGMKGEDLYQNIIKKHITAINEKWDSSKLEKEEMSYMYNILKKSNKNIMDKIGYAYYDINADGIEELLIGEISKGNLKGVIYDIYTMENRKPRHVISGGLRNRYYVCDNSFVCNEYSSGALESGVRVYNLVENSTELFPQVSFKFDAYENKKNPYFISYSDEIWENVTKEKYNERKKVFENYERFNFVPLSKYTCKKSITDKYNIKKDYFDYSVVLEEFPKDFYYTTIKINKSKERILMITDKVTEGKNSYHALFYYFAKNGFVYPLGYLESINPFYQSKNYLYLNNGDEIIKLYISDEELKIIKEKVVKSNENINYITFETIKSAEKFSGDFGEPAGDDIKKVMMEGFYFEYHKPQYKNSYIKKLMKECIKDGVKTQVQMYCCMVNKLHS